MLHQSSPGWHMTRQQPGENIAPAGIALGNDHLCRPRQRERNGGGGDAWRPAR